ncbi:MAG: hypothetical protein ACYTHJ_13190 [Planctomycetota bacterium]
MNVGAVNNTVATRSAMPPPKPGSTAHHDLRQLKKATGEVVGSIFYGSMFKMMRDSAIKGKFGHGGRGEQAFAAQLHDIYAKRMGAQDNGLATVLYDRLETQQRLVSEQTKLQRETQ